MAEFPAEVKAAIDALARDPRVNGAALDKMVGKLRSHLGKGPRHLADLGAELRVAVELLRRVGEVEWLTFPSDDPPDILVRFNAEEIPIEVAHLREGDRGPNDTDARFRAAEEFESALLAQSSAPEAGEFVRRQIATKFRNGRSASGGILVVATDSATNKWTAVACSGVWTAAAEVALGGKALPFAEVVIWYCGPRMVELPRRILTNAGLRTEISAALVERAFGAIRPFEMPGPGDPSWRPDSAAKLLDHVRGGGAGREATNGPGAAE